MMAANQGIGTSVLEKLEKGRHDISYKGSFEWGLEIFKGGVTPWRAP